MPMEDVVLLGRRTLEAALIVGGPILLIATVVSVAINIVQVLTSMQENTVAVVPKLLATGAAAILLMPWMLRRLSAFTIEMFSDLHRYTN